MRSVQADVRNTDIQTVLRDQAQGQRVQHRLIEHDLKVTIGVDASVRLELTEFRLEPGRTDDIRGMMRLCSSFKRFRLMTCP